mgnify:FL=1
MESTLEFLTKNPPSASQFEADYDARVRAGARPGLSKRDFCAAMLETEMRRHEDLVERGQAAIQFCFDLNVHADRGFGDLPDWALETIRDKTIDKLVKRWQRLDIRRTDPRLNEGDRLEAQADQDLLEIVYKTLSGRDLIREY